MPEPMDKSTVIQDVKNLIADGEIGDAFEALATYLAEVKGDYEALYRDVLQAQAKYSKFKKDSTLGIISSEDTKLQFNQSTRQLLYFLELLEKNDTGKPSSSSKTKPTGIIAVVAVVLIGLGVVWWLSTRTTKYEKPLVIEDESCPDYSGKSEFNILILPFQSLGGETGKPHIAILNNLADLIDSHSILSDIKTYLLDMSDPNAYPATNNDASSIAKGCNAQLVIWGLAEKTEGETIIQTKYHFESAESNLPLHRIELTNNSNIDTISSISSISTNGLLTAEIEDHIKIIFGLVAHNTGDNETAVSYLEEVSTKDSATSLLTGMVLAENYLLLEQPEEAKAAYDKVLEQHPDYWLARNNRGLINYQQGHYLDAADDLSVAIEKRSSDVKLLEARGKAYLEAEQYQEAKEDFTKASNLLPTASQAIKENLEKVDTIITNLDSKRINSKSSLRKKSVTAEEFVELASVSKKLGNYDKAIEEATKALSLDKKNVDAYAILLDIYRTKRDDEMVATTLQEIIKVGANYEAIAAKVYFQLKNRKYIRKKADPIK